ncbi:unnamed protein product [Nezara viridula]|uniref:Uncharacterized protein n=1 Tax=Nezara viridula TaxID=85310 RepID=A0A9P0MTZ5_NEZVI|nr:unnamed protein product [Nezara viridula]
MDVDEPLREKLHCRPGMSYDRYGRTRRRLRTGRGIDEADPRAEGAGALQHYHNTVTLSTTTTTTTNNKNKHVTPSAVA